MAVRVLVARRPVERVVALAVVLLLEAGRAFAVSLVDAAAELGVLVTADAGAGLGAGVLGAWLAGAPAGVVPGAEVPEVAMANERARDWGGKGRLQRSCRQTSAVGLPEIDDSADRQIGEHGGVRACQACRGPTGGEHPVAG